MKTSYDEALEIIGEQSTGNNNEGKVKDMFEYKALKKELEELKNNKIIIDKEDTKRYLNVFERKVLKQIVKEIEDNKKLSNVGKENV